MPTKPLPGNLDPFLTGAFDAIPAPPNMDEGLESLTPAPDLPFLVRVHDPAWTPAGVPGFTQTSRVGSVVAGRGTRESLQHLLADPRVHSVEGSRPGGPAGEECATSVPFVGGTKVHTGARKELGDGAIVAVIDNGIDVLHEAFRADSTGTKTRFLGVWDQTDTAGPNPPGFTYGTFHTGAAIDGYAATPATLPAGLDRFRSLATQAGRHGTHVASIAAGRAGGAFAGGMAPAAQILFVVPNLDVAPGKPESVGYSNSHVDALAFIADQANKAKKPVVVNLSQGMNAGAHDGTSTLEAAFDDFTGRGLMPGRAVVKSAGNERGFRGHVFLELSNNTAEEITWRSKPVGRKEDFLEFWFRACDEFEFRLHSPSDPPLVWSPWVTRANPDVTFTTGNADVARLSFQRYCDDNGDSRLAVRVAAAVPTVGAASGEWKLEVFSKAVKAKGELHGWVERINSRPTEFTGAFVDDDLTVSIPGTALTVITVAAVGSAVPYKVAGFSSIGPSRDGREKPTLAAPGDGIVAALRGTANGTEAQSGTSMAAPHVAGAVALLLSHRAKKVAVGTAARQLNTNQVLAALAQVTQNFNGRWTPTMGYGVLDADALLATFD